MHAEWLCEDLLLIWLCDPGTGYGYSTHRMNARLLSQFTVFTIPTPADSSLHVIYSRVMQSILDESPLSQFFCQSEFVEVVLQWDVCSCINLSFHFVHFVILGYNLFCFCSLISQFSWNVLVHAKLMELLLHTGLFITSMKCISLTQGTWIAFLSHDFVKYTQDCVNLLSSNLHQQ